jgi:hypothetical protein
VGKFINKLLNYSIIDKLLVINDLKRNFKIINRFGVGGYYFVKLLLKGEIMEKERIDKFYDDNKVDKIDELKKDYDGNWENPPIPEGKRLVFECY